MTMCVCVCVCVSCVCGHLACEHSYSEPFGRIFTKLHMRDHTRTEKNPIVYGSGRLNTAFRMTDFAARASLCTGLLGTLRSDLHQT